MLRTFPETASGEGVTKRQCNLAGRETQHGDKPDMDTSIVKAQALQPGLPHKPVLLLSVLNLQSLPLGTPSAIRGMVRCCRGGWGRGKENKGRAGGVRSE